MGWGGIGWAGGAEGRVEGALTLRRNTAGVEEEKAEGEAGWKARRAG